MERGSGRRGIKPAEGKGMIMHYAFDQHVESKDLMLCGDIDRNDCGQYRVCELLEDLTRAVL